MGASPDTLAKLAMEIQQDPSLKFLVSRGFIKWEQVLKKDGKGPDGKDKYTIDYDQIQKLRTAMQQAGLNEKSSARRAYASYASQRTTRGPRKLPSGVTVVEPVRWLQPLRSRA